jgi:hypothetical protein
MKEGKKEERKKERKREKDRKIQSFGKKNNASSTHVGVCNKGQAEGCVCIVRENDIW